MKLLFKYFLIITTIVIVLAARRKNHRHWNRDYPQLPAITFDHLSNCYVEPINLKGHCVRYQECLSAVDAWQMYQKIPFSCFYTTYDNFVCCPEAYRQPTILAAILPPSSPQYYIPPVYPIVPSMMNYVPPSKERKSEKECSLIYNNKDISNHKRRHHFRSKRNVDVNKTKTEPSESSELVHEDIIEKVKLSKAQAVGGIQTHRNEFPYMCALGWRKSSKNSDTSYNCGCVLIARKYVLTAAHCATLGGESPSVVRLGGVDLYERHGEMIKIQNIIQHPDYDSQFAYNDIALVKLERGSRKTPACLWSSASVPQETLTALGYGRTGFAGPSSNELLKVFLDVFTNEICNTYYENTDKLQNGINSGQICAGDALGKMDTCQGDSGGPLLMEISQYNTNVAYIVGLTSFGEGCATGIPSVYTRISFFIDWIEDIVWK